MIFVSVNAGHYMIVDNDQVIAEVHARTSYKEYWPKTYYVVVWRDNRLDPEEFKLLSDIQDKYSFTNYKGYNAVLERREAKPKSRRKYGSRSRRDDPTYDGGYNW